MKILSKNHRLCEDVLVEPEKFVPHEDRLGENDSFRMIEVRTESNGHVTVQAVFVQKPPHS